MRLLVVGALVTALLVARLVHARWRRRVASDRRPLPLVPASLLGDAQRTWVVFTTPYCATCEPAVERLRRQDPEARVVTVDATRRPDLADAFHIRRAPTFLLADATGEVRLRTVGPPEEADRGLQARSPA